MMDWLPKVCFGDAFVYRFFGRVFRCLGALYCHPCMVFLTVYAVLM